MVIDITPDSIRPLFAGTNLDITILTEVGDRRDCDTCGYAYGATRRQVHVWATDRDEVHTCTLCLPGIARHYGEFCDSPRPDEVEVTVYSTPTFVVVG